MDSTDSLPKSYLPQPKLYQSKYPNQQMLLYRGFAEVIQGKNIIEGNATVLLVWFPHPNASFEFTCFGETDDIQLGDFTLKLTEIGVSAKGYASRRKYDGADQRTVIDGYFCEPVVEGRGQELASLVFYISNFPFFNISNIWGMEEDEDDLEGWLLGFFDGQFVFQTDEWRIVLATLPDSWDIHELLQKQGGYALTHICKLERLDRSIFSVDDTKDILEAFSYYLSFARGIWVTPILRYGYDANGYQVFEEWSDYHADSWQNNPFWFCTDSKDLPEAFPGFMRRWQNENWRELIQESIQWYVESNNQSRGVDGDIVLQQAALERLAWVFLVEDKRNLSRDGFHKLSAADKNRQLLSHLGISLEIPTRLSNLLAVSKSQNWVDGPQAITEIRNAIVHPDPKKRHKGSGADTSVKNEAWNIGMQYLEMVLLKLFDYPYSCIYEYNDE